jgi:hypothetical protein
MSVAPQDEDIHHIYFNWNIFRLIWAVTFPICAASPRFWITSHQACAKWNLRVRYKLFTIYLRKCRLSHSDIVVQVNALNCPMISALKCPHQSFNYADAPSYFGVIQNWNIVKWESKTTVFFPFCNVIVYRAYNILIVFGYF